jgi:hypothetical protein
VLPSTVASVPQERDEEASVGFGMNEVRIRDRISRKNSTLTQHIHRNNPQNRQVNIHIPNSLKVLGSRNISK